MCSLFFFFFFSLNIHRSQNCLWALNPGLRHQLSKSLNAPLIKTVARQDEGFPKSVSKHRSATVLNKTHFRRDRDSVSQRWMCRGKFCGELWAGVQCLGLTAIPFPMQRPRDARVKAGNNRREERERAGWNYIFSGARSIHPLRETRATKKENGG